MRRVADHGPVLWSLVGWLVGSTSLTRALAGGGANLILRRPLWRGVRLSLELEPLAVVCLEGDDRRVGLSSFRRRVMLSVLGALAVTGVLGFVLAGRRGEFVAAVDAVPVWFLGVAVLLQVVALLARTEAWNVCVCAAGGSVSRRLLFRAAGVGYLASLVNGSLGMAARIASLRRVAPQRAPGVPALLAAEVPIVTVEVGLAAIFSFTLIAPLGIPWWLPVIAVAIIGGAVAVLRRVSERHRTGVWAGLAVVRGGRRSDPIQPVCRLGRVRGALRRRTVSSGSRFRCC